MTTWLVIVGGFLGAGKTTLLLTAAQRLTTQGYRVGLLTNDQGADLVDTALGDQAAIPVTEVAGGCFCCRFPDLLAGLQRLQAVATPDLVLLEPVGSCTDLVATVLRPLLQFHGDQYQLAPLTILLDSTRDLADFPPDVHYLYQQQLSEAELLLLTKTDQLSTAQCDAQLIALRATYPQARLLAASSHTGAGIVEWLSIVLGQSSRNPQALVIDYGRYADAEAALGWLNVKGLVRADQAFSAQVWTDNLLTTLTYAFTAQAAPIAHIKTMVTTPQGGGFVRSRDCRTSAPAGSACALVRRRAQPCDRVSRPFWKRPACDFSARARVSNHSAISAKPSSRAVFAKPGYICEYS